MSIINQLGLNTRVPYHFLLYSFTFGGTAFYSWVVSPIVFKRLPREEFSNLQSHVFPCYFGVQTFAPAVLALISPLKFCPFTGGLLAASAIGGLINLVGLLPVCKTLKEKKNKLIADKQDKGADGEPSEEFAAVTKKFGCYHGVSMLVNVVSIASLGVYGLALAKGLSKL
ncbi:putative mitochondrial outer membrane protein [Spathaspora sp. JA1]|nr:putative mitochondrial outer membrane protein [Spathaspora sp. JA1]